MERILPEMSVDKKLKKDMSVIVGNYEYYYAAGIFSKRYGNESGFPENIGETKPAELMKMVHEALGKLGYVTSTDEKSEDENYLFYLMGRYEPDDKYDENMPVLFERGREKA
jgi:hypothetical protein